MLERDIEIGEIYRNRSSQNMYIITQVEDLYIKYVIYEVYQRATIDKDKFKTGITDGTLIRVGQMTKGELAKYLLQR